MMGKTEIRTPLGGRPRDGRHCDLCGCSQPAVRCDKCGCQIFCLSCDDMYHRHPKRRFHLRKAVDPIPNVAQARPNLPMKVSQLNATNPGDPSKMPLPPPRKKKSLFGSFRKPSPTSENNSPPLPKKEYSWTDRLGSIKKFMSNRPLPPLPSPEDMESQPTTNGQSQRGDLSFIHKRNDERPPQLPQRSPRTPEYSGVNHEKENRIPVLPPHVPGQIRNGSMEPNANHMNQNHEFSANEMNQWNNRMNNQNGAQAFGTLNRQRGFAPPSGPGYPGSMHQSSSATDLHKLHNADGMHGPVPQHFSHYPVNPHMPPHYPYPMYPQYPNYPQYFGNSFANLSHPPTSEGDFSDSESSSKHSSKKQIFRKRAKRSQSVMMDRMAYPGQFFPFGPYPGYGPWGPQMPMEAPPSPASSVRSLTRTGRNRRRKKITSEDDDEELSETSSPMSRPKSSSSDPKEQPRAPLATQTTSSEYESDDDVDKRRNKASTMRRQFEPVSSPSPVKETKKTSKLKKSFSKQSDSETQDVSQAKHERIPPDPSAEQSVRQSPRLQQYLPQSPLPQQAPLPQQHLQQSPLPQQSPLRQSPLPQQASVQQQPSTPVSSASPDTWECKHCTFVNASGNRICQVCCKTASPRTETPVSAPSRPSSSSTNNRKESAGSEIESSSPDKASEREAAMKDKQDIASLNSALDEAEKQISKGLEELMKLKDDIDTNMSRDKSKSSDNQSKQETDDSSKPVYKSSGRMRSSILEKLNLNKPQTSSACVSTSTETQTTQNSMTPDRIIEARRYSNSSTPSETYNSPMAQSPELERAFLGSKQKRDSSCQTQQDTIADYLEKRKAADEAFLGRPVNNFGFGYGDRMDMVTSPVPSMYERFYGGGYGMMQRSHSRASLFTGRMNDFGPMEYGPGFGYGPPIYRSVSRGSLTGDYPDGRLSEFHNLRKPDYYLSMEELVERKRQDNIRAQGLELVRMIREAEQQGFNADDIQVALTHCGKQNPLEWLQENWRNMVDSVVTLSTNYGNDKKENDIGLLSENESRDALRLHKGNIWAAVTECVEGRQRKYLELNARGNFSRQDIVDALTSSEGDVEMAYAKLTKSTGKPFLMRIWGQGEGVPNQDGAQPVPEDIQERPGRYLKDETLNSDEFSDDLWSEDGDGVEWDEEDDYEEEEERGDIEDLRTCHEELPTSPQEMMTPESEKSDYCDAFSVDDRNASSPSDDIFFVIPEAKPEKKKGFLSKLVALRRDSKEQADAIGKEHPPEPALQSKDDSTSQKSVSSSEQQKNGGALTALKNTFSALKDTVTGGVKNDKKIPSTQLEKRTIIVKGQVDHESLSTDNKENVKLTSVKPLEDKFTLSEPKSQTEEQVNQKNSLRKESVKPFTVDANKDSLVEETVKSGKIDADKDSLDKETIKSEKGNSNSGSLIKETEKPHKIDANKDSLIKETTKSDIDTTNKELKVNQNETNSTQIEKNNSEKVTKQVEFKKTESKSLAERLKFAKQTRTASLDAPGPSGIKKENLAPTAIIRNDAQTEPKLKSPGSKTNMKQEVKAEPNIESSISGTVKNSMHTEAAIEKQLQNQEISNSKTITEDGNITHETKVRQNLKDNNGDKNKAEDVITRKQASKTSAEEAVKPQNKIQAVNSPDVKAASMLSSEDAAKESKTTPKNELSKSGSQEAKTERTSDLKAEAIKQTRNSSKSETVETADVKAVTKSKSQSGSEKAKNNETNTNVTLVTTNDAAKSSEIPGIVKQTNGSKSVTLNTIDNIVDSNVSLNVMESYPEETQATNIYHQNNQNVEKIDKNAALKDSKEGNKTTKIEKTSKLEKVALETAKHGKVTNISETVTEETEIATASEIPQNTLPETLPNHQEDENLEKSITEESEVKDNNTTAMENPILKVTENASKISDHVQTILKEPSFSDKDDKYIASKEITKIESEMPIENNKTFAESENSSTLSGDNKSVKEVVPEQISANDTQMQLSKLEEISEKSDNQRNEQLPDLLASSSKTVPEIPAATQHVVNISNSSSDPNKNNSDVNGFVECPTDTIPGQMKTEENLNIANLENVLTSREETENNSQIPVQENIKLKAKDAEETQTENLENGSVNSHDRTADVNLNKDSTIKSSPKKNKEILSMKSKDTKIEKNEITGTSNLMESKFQKEPKTESHDEPTSDPSKSVEPSLINSSSVVSDSKSGNEVILNNEGPLSNKSTDEKFENKSPVTDYSESDRKPANETSNENKLPIPDIKNEFPLAQNAPSPVLSADLAIPSTSKVDQIEAQRKIDKKQATDTITETNQSSTKMSKENELQAPVFSKEFPNSKSVIEVPTSSKSTDLAEKTSTSSLSSTQEDLKSIATASLDSSEITKNSSDTNVPDVITASAASSNASASDNSKSVEVSANENISGNSKLTVDLSNSNISDNSKSVTQSSSLNTPDTSETVSLTSGSIIPKSTTTIEKFSDTNIVDSSKTDPASSSSVLSDNSQTTPNTSAPDASKNEPSGPPKPLTDIKSLNKNTFSVPEQSEQHSKAPDSSVTNSRTPASSIISSTASAMSTPQNNKLQRTISEDNSDATASESDETDIEFSSDSRRGSLILPSPVDTLRSRFEGLAGRTTIRGDPVRPASPFRRMSFNSRKQVIALEKKRDTSADKPWFHKIVPEPVKVTPPKRSVKQQLEMERKVRKMVADRKCRTYRKAEIVVQLMDMNFEEEESIQAANECSTLEQAISYLQQECLLCTGYYAVSQIVSMTHCEHRACRECIRAYFTVQIRDRTILDLLCPFCNEPDIGDEDVAQDYFNHLDIMLKKLVDLEIHELFQRKLRDRVLMKDPNFRWCSQCSSGFIAMPNLKRLICPDCNAVTCASCRRLWEKEHQGISCEAFAAMKDASDPEAQAAGLAKMLTEDGISCPSCHFRYALAKGGCMHFRCIQCQHDFCSGCSRPFKMGQKCGVSEFCAKLGLHAHHPRNCLFYLRDKEPEDLQKLLDMNDVKYNREPPDGMEPKNICQVMEQKETADGMVDDNCGKEIQEGFAGLCRIHYVEYLGQLVNKRKVDPIQIFDNDDLELVLRRANIRLPPKRYRETEIQYREKLINAIQEELPLDKMDGS